jgi:glutaminyl-tRNA synthetase
MTLRAKIDMARAQLQPARPGDVPHRPRRRTTTQGDAWCIYPMYDWAHGLEDSLEGITHSICTLEFENHRPLYDWFQLDQRGPHARRKRLGHEDPPPAADRVRQARLTYTVLSKRNLLNLVKTAS